MDNRSTLKIYLINPPAAGGIAMVREGRCMQRKGAWTTVWPPVTLATMAALLLREGFHVKLDDCIAAEIDFSGLAQRIREFQPDLVVINTATASIESDLSTATVAKEACAAVRTAAFGLHVTVCTEEAFRSAAALDLVIRGEPEFCLVEVCRALRDKTGLSAVNGIAYREGADIVTTPDRGFDDDLNRLPVPAWELVDVSRYPMPLQGESFLLVTTSKGCPHGCLFCPAKPYYGTRLRLRLVRAVLEEMEEVRRKCHVRTFLIWSESFTEEREYVVEFCRELIRRKADFRWVCNSRVDKVDPELLALMKEAGCWMIGYGIESGDQAILDAACKGITVAQAEAAVRWAKAAGLEVTAHVLFGLPGETMETGKRTIRWLKRQAIDFVQFYCAVPWPSTPLYTLAQQRGWLITGEWARYEQNYSVMDIGTIDPRQVEQLRRLGMRSIYLSPKRIVHVLSTIDSVAKLKLFVEMIREFVSWI